MKDNWINITERLPDYSGGYKVEFNGKTMIAYFADLDETFYDLETKEPVYVERWRHK